MKFLYLLIPSLALVACAGQRPSSTGAAPAATQTALDGTLPDSDDVREPSRVHTYIVNDYIDPNNPRLRHRGHLVDVVEQDEKWNLAPTDPSAPPESNLGPVATANDANAAPNPYSAEFETELAQQRDQYHQLADLGTKMTAEVGKLQDMAEKSADVISENADLRNRLSELQQEIDAIKPASPPPLMPDAPAKRSWWDWIRSFIAQPPQGKPIATPKLATQTSALLRPAITNAPPTNSADETVPDPGEMSANAAHQP